VWQSGKERADQRQKTKTKLPLKKKKHLRELNPRHLRQNFHFYTTIPHRLNITLMCFSAHTFLFYPNTGWGGHLAFFIFAGFIYIRQPRNRSPPLVVLAPLVQPLSALVHGWCASCVCAHTPKDTLSLPPLACLRLLSGV
jgi:hypothetical protein